MAGCPFPGGERVQLFVLDGAGLREAGRQEEQAGGGGAAGGGRRRTKGRLCMGEKKYNYY